jgi:hypothetical protein
VDVNLGGIGDPDFDGREQVQTEMIQLQLSSAVPDPQLGPILVRLRSPSLDPFQRTLGEIEENANTQLGRLDVPPFAASGTAGSFFDVFFEVELPAQGLRLHNRVPKRMSTTIQHKPPAPGDTYESPEVIQLFDEAGNPTPFRIRLSRHTPRLGGLVAVGPGQVPERLSIQSIRPNPVTGSAQVTYGMPKAGRVRLDIYDLSGRVMRTLVDRRMDAGVHTVTWTGLTAVKRVVLLRK